MKKGINIKRIQEYIAAGKDHFVIIPFGGRGREIKSILNNQLGIQEQFCVDNYHYDMQHVFPLDNMPEGYKDCLFLITAEDDALCTELEGMLLKYIDSKQVIRETVAYEEEDVFQSNEKIKLDFLCVGMPKCGTTSLHNALCKNNSIFLPMQKETHFIKDINWKTHDDLHKSYPSEARKNKIVGGIEPSYFENAEKVYKYFGPDLKILFCVTNPVKALYSFFKMNMRTFPGKQIEFIKKYGVVSPEMFDEYAEVYYKAYFYMKYVSSYLAYYPKEQIKIIISEEMYQKTGLVMHEIQDFIGLPKEKWYSYKEFPHTNVGASVAKNYEMAQINQIHFSLNYAISSPEEKTEVIKNFKKICEVTTCLYTEKMLDKTKKRLLEYYMPSIHELEEFMGRSLEGIWY